MLVCARHVDGEVRRVLHAVMAEAGKAHQVAAAGLDLHHVADHLFVQRRLRGDGDDQRAVLDEADGAMFQFSGGVGFRMDYFDVISGADDHYVHSKVGRAQAIAKSYDLRSDDILVIGDCVQDYMVSQALGAECVLLSAGHQSREDLSSTGALVVDSLLDICEIVG